MGLTYFSKYRKTEGARRQSCQQLKVMTPNIDGKVTNVEKSAKFHHSLTNVFIACGSKLQHGQARFSLSLLRPLNDEKWAVFLPSGPGQHIPNLACCGHRTKKTWELLLPCSAVWQVSWLNTISMLKFPPCDWHLHFTCWNATLWAQSIFISGLKQFDFPADFFEPKEKLVCHTTRCHSGFGSPLPNFPLEHRSYHIWWLILFASFLSMFFSITTQYSSIKVKKTAISFQFCRIY